MHLDSKGLLTDSKKRASWPWRAFRFFLVLKIGYLPEDRVFRHNFRDCHGGREPLMP